MDSDTVVTAGHCVDAPNACGNTGSLSTADAMRTFGPRVRQYSEHRKERSFIHVILFYHAQVFVRFAFSPVLKHVLYRTNCDMPLIFGGEVCVRGTLTHVVF